LAAVVAAHLIGILLLEHMLNARKVKSRPAHAPALLFFLDPRQETIQPERDRSTATSSAQRKQPAEMIAPAAPPNSSIQEPLGEAPDWYEEAEAAAGATVERERERAALRSFQHRFSPPPPPEKPGIFGSHRNRRAGMVEGGDRFWVTDNCYFEYDRKPRDVPQAGDIRLKTATCKPPPTGGGSRMFDHLKPGHLRDRSAAGSN
jgi:hypothetical protein